MIDIDCDMLRAALKRASTCAAKRTTKPVLTCVLIETLPDQRLRLTCTDSERRAEVTVAVQSLTTDPVRVCIAADWLTSVVSKLSGTIQLRESGTQFEVSSGKNVFRRATVEVEDFPGDTESVDSRHWMTLAMGDLRKSSKTVLHACGRDNARFAITGMLFEAEEGTLRLVATDTKRLAVCRVPADVNASATLDGGGNPRPPVLVPGESVRAMGVVLDSDEQPVELVLRGNSSVEFRQGDAVLSTRLVEGRYPPWRDIVPKKHSRSVTIDVGAIKQATGAAATASDTERKNAVFVFGESSALVSCNSVTNGESNVELGYAGGDAGEGYGQDLTTNLDPEYIGELFGNGATGELTVRIVDGMRPILFVVGAGTDRESMELVMPLAS